MKNLSKLFLILNYTPTEVGKFVALSDFFINADDNEKKLFKEYLNPDSVSFIGEATLDKINCGSTQNDVLESGVVLEAYNNMKNGFYTGHDAIRYLSTIFSGLSESSKHAFEIVLVKRPIGLSYKTVNKFYKKTYNTDFISVFNIQLANKYERTKRYEAPFFYASAKLDGLRCYYSKQKNGLFTRSNKPHKGFEEISQVCKALCEEYSLAIIDGELYTDAENFEKLNGVIRKADSILKDRVNLVIFAVVPFDKSNYDTADMVETMNKMSKWLERMSVVKVSILDNFVVQNNYKDIQEKTYSLVEKGFEGLMLRNPYSFYDFKRSNNLLKVKLFQEDDFEIVDCFEGKGKYVGMLGGFRVKKGDIVSEVGTGFTDEERDFFWATRDTLIGKIVNVKYFSLTDSGKSLRHPVFLKFK